MTDGSRQEWSTARTLAWQAGARAARWRSEVQRVALDQAIGRTLAQDVRALYDVPHYRSSAMDGWAVAGEGPWQVVPEGELRPGDARRVVTGGLIPAGTDGILRSEHALVAGSTLETTVVGEPRQGQHIRAEGQEATRDEIVVRSGSVLNPARIALAAVCGHDELDVHRAPRVALVFTGDEVVERGRPAPGQVRDTFGPQLGALVTMLGGSVEHRERIGDDLAATTAAIEDGLRHADLVISTGGTGHSPADHIRPALAALDAELLVSGVAMRPGGPSLLARAASGGLVVGLPGNPLAAIMGALTLAQPLLAGLLGRELPTVDRTPLLADVAGRSGSTLLVPWVSENGAARPTLWHGAGMMRGLAEADGVLVVQEGGLSAGDSAPSIRLPW